MFEDDITFIDNFDNYLKTALLELPRDWDALWLGGSDIQSTYNGAFTRRMHKGTGGYAILFRHTCYNKLIKALTEEKEIADICYMKANINAYRTSFNIVFHNDGYSYIQKKEVSYPKLNGTKG